MSRNGNIKSIVINAEDTERMLEDFTDEEAGKILKGLLAYANRGDEFKTDDRAMRCLFKNIQATIDCNYDKYEAKCERNRQIAMQREKKKKQAQEKHEREPNDTNVHERARTQPIENKIEITNIKVIKEAKASNIKAPKGATSETSSDAAYAPDKETKIEVKSNKKEDIIDFEKLRLQFNRLMETKKIPKLKGKISGQRKAFFEARVREYGMFAAYRVMIKAAQSNFLNGGGSKAWLANFEWMFRPNNFPKVLDGYYDTQNIRVIPTPIIKQQDDETPGTTAAGTRTVNRDSQRTMEQQQRIKGYAGVANKWRQRADEDTQSVENQTEPPADIPR